VRYSDAEGAFHADGIHLADEKPAAILHHPTQPHQKSKVSQLLPEGILFKVMEKGKALAAWGVAEAAAYAKERLARLPAEHRRFENPHVYKVGATKAVLDLRKGLMRRILGDVEET
jgi:nicotinate phosphoribosyltransferase